MADEKQIEQQSNSTTERQHDRALDQKDKKGEQPKAVLKGKEPELFYIDELAKKFEFKNKKGMAKKLSPALFAGVVRHYRWPVDKKMSDEEFKKKVEDALKLPAHKF